MSKNKKKIIIIVVLVIVCLCMYPILLIVSDMVLRKYFWEPYSVTGTQMVPTLKNEQITIIKKGINVPKRNEIVLYSYLGKKYYSRVVAISGDQIEITNGKVFINNKLLKEGYISGNYTNGYINTTLASDEYFVLNDNRKLSTETDSRLFGPIKSSQIEGVVTAIF